jgi:hypothetical protein
MTQLVKAYLARKRPLLQTPVPPKKKKTGRKRKKGKKEGREGRKEKSEKIWECWCIPEIPALRKLRQVDHKFEVSLGYIMRPFLKRNKSKKTQRVGESIFNSCK